MYEKHLRFDAHHFILVAHSRTSQSGNVCLFRLMQDRSLHGQFRSGFQSGGSILQRLCQRNDHSGVRAGCQRTGGRGLPNQ